MSAVKVHLYDDATLKSSPVVSGGAWSVSALSLTAGEHILKGRAEDAAGNLSGYSGLKRIITGNTTKPTVDLIDDSGQSSSDNITNDTTPTLYANIILPTPTGTSYASSNSVSAIKLYKKTGTSTYELLETDNAPDNINPGTWRSVFNDIGYVADGVYELCATWVDAQGNESAKGSVLSVTIDTTAPDAPSIDNISDGQVFVGTSIDVSGSAS
jgi:hypothetical protein